MNALIEFQDVCKYYHMGDTTVVAADHISFQIRKGEFVAIVGSSGSGKSTCMNIIGCLDVPSEGTYLLDGRDVGQMNKNKLAEIRNALLGFIFQQYNLLPKLNLVENVEVPLIYAGVPRAERRERARIALEMVGLGDKLQHKPSQPVQSAGSGPESPWRWWGWVTSSSTSPASSPAASSSGCPLPGPWWASRRSFWPTSLPAPWTPRRAARSSPSSRSSTPRATPWS